MFFVIFFLVLQKKVTKSNKIKTNIDCKHVSDLSSSRIDLLSNIGLPLPSNVDFRNGWFGFSTFDVKENAKLG